VARVARLRLPRGARAYLDGGGEGEYTLRRNRAAFDLLEFLPRQPREVSEVDTATTVLGERIPLPLVLSPVGAPPPEPRPPRPGETGADEDAEG